MARAFRFCISPPIDPERSRTRARLNWLTQRGGRGGGDGGIGGNGGSGADGGFVAPQMTLTESMAMSPCQEGPRTPWNANPTWPILTPLACSQPACACVVDCCPLRSHRTPPSDAMTFNEPMCAPYM